MPPSARPLIVRYGAAIATTGLALLVITLLPTLHGFPFIFLGAAIVFSAWIAGLRSGLAALVISTLWIAVLFGISPSHLPLNAVNMARFATFTVLAVLILLMLHSKELTAERLEQERERLRIANQSFATVFQAAPLGVIVMEPDGRVRLWGPAAERILGYRSNEVVGELAPGIPPERQEEFRLMLQTAAGSTAIVTMESQRMRKDGSLIDVGVSAAPLRNDEGEVTGYIAILDDITQSKRSQQALRESEQHLRRVLDSLFTFVAVLQPDGTLIEANLAALEAASLKSEDVLGKPFEKTYWWSFSPHVQSQLRSAIDKAAAGEASRFDVEIRHTQDRRTVYDFMIAPMRNAEQDVTHLVASAIDVTERYRANERLAESEARYRAIGESIPYGVWMADAEGNLSYMSQSLLDLIGKTMDEMRGINWMLNMPANDAKQVIAAWRDTTAMEQFWNNEYQLTGVDGKTYWILSRGVPVRSEGGQQIGWAGVSLDITERKKEEHLTARLQATTEALSEAITREQVADRVITHVKEAIGGHLATVAVITENQQEVMILHSQGLPDRLRRMFDRLPINYPGALNQCIVDNEPIWVENQAEYLERFPEVAHVIRDETKSQATACLPLRVGDKVLGGLGISFAEPRVLSAHERKFLLSIADATALALERAHLYDAEAQARHTAERADWLKTQFLAIVSHELRTPLTSIKGFATTLLQEDIDWDAESQHDFLQIIDAEADKLAEMIEQLLDFSRIEAGTLRIQAERTTIDAVMEFALPQLQIITQGHRLSMDLQPNLPHIHADRRRISQVLTNIIVNAVRYSPKGSVISVSTYVDRAHIRVDVADQGPGILPEDRAHVFEAFQQGANRPPGESKGAGLGLAIARGIIEAHDGEIWVDDRPGPGTLISFVLPVDLRMDDDEISEQTAPDAVDAVDNILK